MAISNKLKSASKKLDRASKKAKNAEQAYAAGKKVGRRTANKKNSFITSNSLSGRKVVGQFLKVNTTGGKVKGNALGKTAAVAGVVVGGAKTKAGNAVGSAKYKMTAAREAALKKAQQASARIRKMRG